MVLEIGMEYMNKLAVEFTEESGKMAKEMDGAS